MLFDWIRREVFLHRTEEEEAYNMAALRAVDGTFADLTPAWVAERRVWLSQLPDPRWRKECEKWVDYFERKMERRREAAVRSARANRILEGHTP